MENMPKIDTIQTLKSKFVFRKPHNPAMLEAFKRALAFPGSRMGDTYKEVQRRVHSLNQKEKFRRT